MIVAIQTNLIKKLRFSQVLIYIFFNVLKHSFLIFSRFTSSDSLKFQIWCKKTGRKTRATFFWEFFEFCLISHISVGSPVDTIQTHGVWLGWDHLRGNQNNPLKTKVTKSASTCIAVWHTLIKGARSSLGEEKCYKKRNILIDWFFSFYGETNWP